jgi:uncharacterized cupin superfamily protein
MMNDPKITRMEPHGPAGTGMVEWDPIDPKSIESGSPVQRGNLYFNDADLGLMAGVWDCTPFTGSMAPYDVNEFMSILEGSVTMVLADGTQETINAGESFVIPKGLVCRVHQKKTLLAFALSDHNQMIRSSPVTLQTPASSLVMFRNRANVSITWTPQDSSWSGFGTVRRLSARLCRSTATNSCVFSMVV